MSKERVKLQAPVEIEVKVSITNEGGSKVGTVTIGIGAGRYPSEAEMRESVAEFVKDQMPDGFRLMTKREWFNNKFGQAIDVDDDGEPIRVNFAIPGGEDWDA